MLSSSTNSRTRFSTAGWNSFMEAEVNPWFHNLRRWWCSSTSRKAATPGTAPGLVKASQTTGWSELEECADTSCVTHVGLSSFHLCQGRAEWLQPRPRKFRWVLFAESKPDLPKDRKDELTGADESAIFLMQAFQVKELLPIGRIIQPNGLGNLQE